MISCSNATLIGGIRLILDPLRPESCCLRFGISHFLHKLDFYFGNVVIMGSVLERSICCIMCDSCATEVSNHFSFRFHFRPGSTPSPSSSADPGDWAPSKIAVLEVQLAS